MDTGDIIHTSKSYDERFHRFIVDGMNRMGYDCVTLGELELERGESYVRELSSRFKAKVVLSNVTPESGEAPWLESAIIEKGGKRIAVVGLVSEKFGQGTTEPLASAGWKIEDPEAALARLLPSLRRKADLVVALAHLDQATLKKLEREEAGLDLVVAGHMPGLGKGSEAPDSAATTVLLPGQRGEYLGRTELLAAGAKKEKAAGTGSSTRTFGKLEAITVDLEKIGEDAKMAKELEEIKAAIANENRKAQLEQELETHEGLVLGQDRFMGEETCARCHSPVAVELAGGPHAHAFATLEKVGRGSDKSCLPCHVTGFGAAGGFGGLGANGEMKNVTCESCHGMGTNHDWAGKTASAGEAACLQCHVPEWSPRWEYSTYLKRLGHGASRL